MRPDPWAALAAPFVDGAYATVKGRVRTYVLDRQLAEHLSPAPGSVLDVGGGAGHQSFLLAEKGYDVVLLDSSPAMLDKARRRRAALDSAVAQRITLVEAAAEDAVAAVDGRRFDAVLCHGVLNYLESPAPVVEQLCLCAAPGGLVSVMTANADATAVRPALEQRWADALAAFDDRRETGVLGVPSRADTVDELEALMFASAVEPVAWYGVWLFVDWLGFAGVTLDPDDQERLKEIAAAEFEAAGRDPYRQLSRDFHLVGRRRR